MEHITEKAIRIFAKYYQEKYDILLSHSDIHIAWFSKTLQNWKAMIITMKDVMGGYYYEVTYNGDKKETYIDVYKKQDNVTIPD